MPPCAGRSPAAGSHRSTFGTSPRTMRVDLILGVLVLALRPVSVASAAPPAAAAQVPSSAARVHQVQQGDTLYGIAGRYGVTVGSILSANGIKTNSVRLKLGQRLTIPP